MQVCKGFDWLFLNHPHWSGLLRMVPNRKGDLALERMHESLLAWLRRHRDSVKIFCGYNLRGSSGTSALQMLSCPGHQLQNVSLWDPSVLDMAPLSAFTALKSCCLSTQHPLFPITEAHPTELDLKPLHNLPHLQRFVASNGKYGGLDALKRLTSLAIISAEVRCDNDCAFADQLEVLNVSRGRLYGLHSNGLPACQRLQALCLRRCVITATSNENTLDLDAWTPVPAAMTAVSLLTYLKVVGGSELEPPVASVMCLDWVTCLTSLQELYLCSIKASFELPLGMSRLEMLRSLTINVKYSSLKLFIHWPSLCCLSKVDLWAGRCEFDSSLLGLPRIQTLSEVMLNFDSCNAECAVHFAALLHEFQNVAPSVKLVYQHPSVTSICAEVLADIV